MYKDNLFELIRKEEVVIWAGSGLSQYAGFPSGQTLGSILVKNLSKAEQQNINVNLPLPDLAEEFFRLKGNNRNTLIRILIDTFINKQPESTEYHERLSIIPHFKTIITTNYDTLIEDAFKQNGQVVISSKQIAYLEKQKTQIFKVHGDLSEPDSIIITKSDYNKFFKDNSENDVYWNVIKERLTTKNVLFLGYNIEDPNVSVIFDRITDALGSNRKECFLVAPNLPQHKVNDLIKRGIHYLNCTAAEIILDLIQNIKEHIIGDLESGETTADTFRKFLSNIDILPDIKAESRNYKVQALHGTSENVEGKINFSIKSDPEFISELEAYMTGKKFGNFEIAEDKILNADFRYGGLKFPDLEGISKLEFKSIPKISTTIDVRFHDGTEFIDIPVKLYGSHSVIEIHIELKNANLIVNMDITKLPETTYNFNYEHDEICKNVKDEIELFTFLSKLGGEEQFTVYAKSGESFSKTFPKMIPLIKESQYYLEYFNVLKLIEHHYRIRFSNINIHTITESTFNKVGIIKSSILGESIEYNWDDELPMDLIEFTDETLDQLKIINEVNEPVEAHYKVEEIIELHGHSINIGFKKVQVLESFVANLKSIIEEKEKTAIIKSKSKKIRISYSQTDE